MTIKDLPLLESSQYQFISNMPVMGDLVRYVNNPEYKKNFGRDPKLLTPNVKMARYVNFETTAQLIISKEAMDQYGQTVVLNANRFLLNFIKKKPTREADRLPILSWFIVQIIDMGATSKYGKLSIFDENDMKNLDSPEFMKELIATFTKPEINNEQKTL